MMQTYERRNCVDEHGHPSGGSVNAVGVNITWQNGPLGRGDERKNPNGAFVETVIAAALQRIQWYQTASGGKFACRENAIAVTKLEEALMWLDSRTRRREMEGTEGTHIYEEATRTDDTVAALVNRVLSLEDRVSQIGRQMPAVSSSAGIPGIALHDPEGTTGTCEGKLRERRQSMANKARLQVVADTTLWTRDGAKQYCPFCPEDGESRCGSWCPLFAMAIDPSIKRPFVYIYCAQNDTLMYEIEEDADA